MILYTKRYGGFPLLFSLQGTSWPYGILPAVCSTCIGLVIGSIPTIEDVVSGDNFMDHPYPFQLYAFIIGFLVVFRTNFAYQRYWEGRGTIAQMGSKWLDGACMALAFDATGDPTTPFMDGVGMEDEDRLPFATQPTSCGAASHTEFCEEVLHLFSLMHALAMQHFRGDTNLDNLKCFSIRGEGNRLRRLTALPDAPQWSHVVKPGQHTISIFVGNIRKSYEDVYQSMQLQVIGELDLEERQLLQKDSIGKEVPTEARVTMVESWIMRRLLARQKHEKSDMAETSAPILSRLYQVISDGCIGFGQASKLVDTPFPFPYQNIIQVFLWIYVCIVPFVMNAWLKNMALRATLTFLAVWCYFALHQVGNNLEDPYIPYDPNELALTYIQHGYNAKLLSYLAVPRKKPKAPELDAGSVGGSSRSSRFEETGVAAKHPKWESAGQSKLDGGMEPSPLEKTMEPKLPKGLSAHKRKASDEDVFEATVVPDREVVEVIHNRHAKSFEVH